MVFTVPKRLRIFFRFDRKLVSELPGCAWRALQLYFAAWFDGEEVVLAWQDRARQPAQLYAVAVNGVVMSFLSKTCSSYFCVLMALVLASAGVKEKAHDGG